MTLAELCSASLVRYTGLAALLCLGYQFLCGFYEFLRTRLFPVNFKDYGQYAVVTGSTDGIGKGLAFQLAKDGLDIVLISRNAEKLKNTAQEIETKYKVKTICIQADFSSRDIYEKIENVLKDLDIAMLVNNVGIATAVLKEYFKFSFEELREQLDTNITSAVNMTRIVLPHMKAKRKGYVVNISSMSAVYGLPYTGLYPSSKAFLQMFSISLASEMERYNIRIKCLIPGVIRTKLIKNVEDSLKKFDSIIPNCDVYVNHAYKSLSSSSIILTGYWKFTFLAYFAQFTSLYARMLGVKYFERSYFQKHKLDDINGKTK